MDLNTLGWWTLPILVGSMIVYHLMYVFTVGVGIWPRRPGVHSFHQVEGALWPITWAILVAIALLKGTAWVYNLAVSLFYGLGRKVGGPRHGVVRDTSMERRLEGIRTPKPDP